MMLRDVTKQRSHIAILIDNATNGSAQKEENWSLFMKICDLIQRSRDEGVKDAVRAIRKRLGCKVPEDIFLTLKLLDACMKSCGRLFHCHIATPKFMQELVKVMNPKYHPTVGMQNMVLGLIQAWAQSFQTVPELREFQKTMQDLKLKGVEFPPVDPELLIQLQQPKKTVSTTAKPYTQSAFHVDSATKFKAELSAVRNNCNVFGEMLTEMKPGQGSASDLELLEDLNSTCRQMQKRITELIESAQFEKHIEDLLLVNDELNNAFLRYDRFKRLQSQGSTVPEPFQLEPNIYESPPAYNEASSGQTNTNIYDNASSVNETLIDLATPTPTSNTTAPSFPPAAAMAGLAIYDNANDTAGAGFASNFDPFLVPNQPPWQQPLAASFAPTMSSTAGTAAAATVTDKESEYEEMAKWLKDNPRESKVDNTASVDEFDQFLSQRAQEIEQLPNVTADQTKPADTNQSELLLF